MTDKHTDAELHRVEVTSRKCFPGGKSSAWACPAASLTPPAAPARRSRPPLPPSIPSLPQRQLRGAKEARSTLKATDASLHPDTCLARPARNAPTSRDSHARLARYGRGIAPSTPLGQRARPGRSPCKRDHLSWRRPRGPKRRGGARSGNGKPNPDRHPAVDPTGRPNRPPQPAAARATPHAPPQPPGIVGLMSRVVPTHEHVNTLARGTPPCEQIVRSQSSKHRGARRHSLAQSSQIQMSERGQACEGARRTRTTRPAPRHNATIMRRSRTEGGGPREDAASLFVSLPPQHRQPPTLHLGRPPPNARVGGPTTR